MRKEGHNKRPLIRGIGLVLAILILLTAVPSLAFASEEIVPQSLPFNDVAGHWAYQNGAIPFVFESGIMGGTSSTTFAPDAPMSRAMVAATLFRIFNVRSADASDSRQNPFSDVPESEWFAPYVAWAYTNNVVSGIGNNQFAPLATVDRQQFATMLHRLTGIMLDGDVAVRQGAQWNNFTDRGQTASWAVDALTWANYHGLMTGRTATSIAPTGTVTRAEVATILMRFAEWRTIQFLGQTIVSAGMFWDAWWSLSGQFAEEHIVWGEDVPAHLVGVYHRLSPTSGFTSLDDIRNTLSFFYTEAWINFELSTESAPFVAYNGVLYIHTARYGSARPDWSTAAHTVIELIDWNRGEAVIETSVLMRYAATGDTWEEPFRFTFADGRIASGRGAWDAESSLRSA
ncbi:MAG: S-layer homology domain-containing protein [Oscillospiraceae bacterium]|nr:S-layer homology domain-containing protein [Oscillospiraceae bacterium]